jgi:26S proteasome regulatory subunit, ATPase 3, interacting protein
MDETISSLRTSLPTLRSTLKTATAKLQTILSAPTTTALSAMIATLQQNNEKKKEKLQGLKDGTVKQVSKEDVERIEKEERYWKARAKGRKEAFKVLEELALGASAGEDGVGMTREELWEKVGIEGDD